HSKWSSEHRLGTKLNSLRHRLEAANREIDLVPLAFLNCHEQQHDVGADGEMLRVIGDNEGIELTQGLAAGLERLRDELNDVCAQRIHLRVEFDAAYAISQIDQRGRGILLDDATGFLRNGNRPYTFGNFRSLIARSLEIKKASSRGRMRIIAIPGRGAARQQLLNIRRHRTALLFHALNGGRYAGRVPHFERAHIPIETGAHGAIYLDHRVGNLGNAIGRVGPEL